MKTPHGTEVDIAAGHIVLDGFPAHVYCGHGCPSQLLLSSCRLSEKTILAENLYRNVQGLGWWVSYAGKAGFRPRRWLIIIWIMKLSIDVHAWIRRPIISVLFETYTTTRMWINAQRDGRPAKYRWRPLFNARKVWLTSTTIECRAVTLPRRETR